MFAMQALQHWAAAGEPEREAARPVVTDQVTCNANIKQHKGWKNRSEF